MRRYVTLTQDIDPPKGGATYCHILDVVGPRIMDIPPVVPRRGATLCHIDIEKNPPKGGATIGRIDILINL